MNTKTSNKTKDIIAILKKAFLENKLEVLEDLLDENGSFDVQDQQLDCDTANKSDFIQWIGEIASSQKVESVELDQCLYCEIGNPVLIINNGKFPRKVKESSERSKTGLMISEEDGKIKEIKFCFVFAKTDNPYQFECDLRKKYGDPKP